MSLVELVQTATLELARVSMPSSLSFSSSGSSPTGRGGSHKTLARAGWPDCVFAFHDREEIGPKMLARISKRTGLTREDV